MTPWDDDAAAPGLAPLKSKATDLDPFFYAGEPVVPPRMDLPVASPIPGVAVQPGRATPSGLVGLSMRAHELLGLPQPAEYEKFQKLPPAPPVITPPDNDSGIADWEPVRRDVDVGQSALNFAPQVVGAVAEGAGDIARGAGQSVGALGRLAEWAYPQYQQVEKALAAKGAGQEVDGVTPPPPKFTPQSDGTFTSADISAAAGQQPDLAKAYARSGEWLDLAGDAMKGWARDNTPDRQVPSVDMVKDWRTALVYGMESVAQATGSTVPTLAAYAVSGPFAAAIPTYAMSVGQMRDSMERAGIDPREQDAIILAGGAVMGRIEMMSHGALSDLFKEQLGKHVVRRMMTAGGRGGATEGLEEILQEATQIAGEAIAKGENVGLALLSDEGLARIKEAGAQAFVGGFGIGAGGTGLRYARQATAEQIKSWADARERATLGDATVTPEDVGLTSIFPERHGDGKSEPLAAITVYHGSPHDFDRFDSSKIGSGEGAQSFGHGLYFAENMAVADQYRRELALDKGQYIGPVYSRKELEELSKAAKSSDQKEAIDWILWLTRRSEKEGGYSFKQAVSTSSLLTLKDAFGDSHVRLPGHIYEVRLDAEPHHLLDWDAPWSAQPDAVKSAVASLGMSEEITAPTMEGTEPTGATVYMRMAREIQNRELAKIDKPGISPAEKRLDYGRNTEPDVSRMLASAGVPGIRYFDGASRSNGDGTRNYVVFDPKILEITHKNGEPVKKELRDQIVSEVAPLAQLRPDDANDRAAKFKAWKEKKEAEKLIEPKTTAEIISSRLTAGMPVPIPERLSGAIIDMIAPMRSIIPDGARVGVVANIRPDQSSAETAIVDVRTLDGTPFAVIVNRDQMLDSKALFLPRSRAIVLLPFDEFDRLAEGTHGGLVEDIPAIIRGSFVHEMTHLLSRSGVMPADDFRRLVDHSNLLGVLDLPVREYFRLNGTPDYNSISPTQTIRESYERLYANFSDVQEAIDQEAAAIFMEMVNRGAVDKSSRAAVQDVIDRYFSGASAAIEPSGQEITTPNLATITERPNVQDDGAAGGASADIPAGYALKLPFKDKWGDTRTNARDAHRATEALRKIYADVSFRPDDIQPLFAITGRSKAPSLVAAIREMGGIRDVTGDIRKMMGARPGQSGYIPGIINKNGVHPDKAREALVNGGWLLETVGDGEARTTVNDLYDLLDRMFRGERVHPQTPSDITEHLDLMDEERGVVAQEQYDDAVAQVIERVDAYIDEHGLAPLTERERRRLSTIASPSWTNDDIDSALEELYIETVEIADATAKAGLTAAEDLRVLELQKQGMDIADAIEQAKQETFARMEESEARAAGLERREDAAGGEPGAIDSRGAGASSQGNGRASAQQGQLAFPLPPAVPPGTGGAPALPATTAGSGGFGGIPPLPPRGGFTPPPGGRPPGGPPAGGLPPPTYPYATPGRAPGLIGRAWNAFLGWYNPVNRIPQANRYRIGKYKTLGKIARANDIARSIWEDLHKASNRDQRAAYDYLTTRGATPNTIGDAKVRQAAIDAKRIIDMLGQALVSRGLIPQQSYDKYRDQYLPRIYLKHMIERHGGSLSGFANAARPSDMGYTKQRKEIDKEARLLMGEITDPGFLAARGILRTYRDIALIDFLDTISQNHSWVFDRGLVPFKGRNVSPFWLKAEAEELSYRAIFEPDSANRQRMISEANAMRALAVPYIRDNENVPDGYAQIPDTQRYGMLRGMWVRKEIKEDLLPGMEILPDDASSLQRFFSPNGFGGRASSLWKAMKVPMNPATQVRNFISNMIMLNLSGMGPVDIPRYIGRAASEMYTDGHYYKAAKSRGLTASGFSEQELVKISREFLDIDRKLARQSSFFPILYPFVIARELATRVIGLSGEFYQKAESLTKLAKMIHDVEQSGRSIDDAYLEAQKWLFDYSEVPSAIRYLRNVPFGAPFVTYFYKAFPVLLEAAATKPWRLAPYVALPHIAAAFFAFLHDVDKDDVEKLKQSLPEFLRSKENAMMLPVKDAAGRWQFFDFGYLLPWSMFQEAGTQAAKGEASEAIRTAGLLGGPIADMIVTLKTGIDPFTKRPIYDKRDPPQDQMRDIMSYLARATLPPWMTDQSFALKMWDAYKQNPTKYGDPPLTMGQAAARGFGMNVYPVEPEVSRARSLKKFDSEIRDLQSRMRQQLRDRRLSDDERQTVAQKYGDMITKAKQRKEEYARKSEINPKLLAGHDGQDHSKINDWQPVAQPSGGPGDWVPVRP